MADTALLKGQCPCHLRAGRARPAPLRNQAVPGTSWHLEKHLRIAQAGIDILKKPGA